MPLAYEDRVHDEVFRQIVRLKRQWGYGRWSLEEARAVAEEAAQRASEIAVSFGVDETRDIPRILHRVVPERVSEWEEELWAGFVALHPGWEFWTWRDPLDPADFPVLGPLWKDAKNGAQLADMIRTEILHRHGGVYVDADVRAVRPLDPLLEDGGFAAWEDDKTVPNAVMGFYPGHPAVGALLAYMQERLPGPTWWAGPGATTAMLPGRSDVALYEPSSFYPVHYRRLRTAEDREVLDAVTAETHPDTWAVHYYAGSWLRR